MRIEYDLTLPEDYIINSGTSTPGLADNAVVRDSEGLPYVPHKTLKGLIRDALASLCKVYAACGAPPTENHALWTCDGEIGGGRVLCGINARGSIEPCIICRLFGSQGVGEGKLVFTDARLPAEIREILRHGPTGGYVREGTRQIRSHNMHDPVSRRARDYFLYTLESLSPLGGKFEGSLFVRPGHPSLTKLETRLLLLAFRAVQRLGGKRTRGHGTCRFEATSPPEAKEWHSEEFWTKLTTLTDEELAEFANPWEVGAPAGDLDREVSEPESAEPADGDPLITVEVNVTAAHADITLTADQWVGNLVSTQEFVSGRRLRGVLAAMFYEAADLSLPGSRELARKLFFSSSTRFENCYPVFGGSQRAVPMALSTLACKTHPPDSDRPHAVVDILGAPVPEACTSSGCGAPLERAGGWRSADSALGEVEKRSRTSTALENGTARQGRLFTHQSVRQGSEFLGAIRITPALWSGLVLATGVRLDTDIDVVLGASCPAVVRFSRAEQEPPTAGLPWVGHSFDDRWPEAEDPPQDGMTDVTVTLLSDALIADDLGEAVPVVGDDQLLRELGLSDTGVTVQARFQAAVRVAGWNVVWGLPLGQEVGTAAGSCFRLAVPNAALQQVREKLRLAEQGGIGRRRNEGFGRLLVDDFWHVAMPAQDGGAS